MEIKFQNMGPETWKGEIMLYFGLEDEEPLKICPELDLACPWLAVAPALRDFKGVNGEMAILHGHPDLNIPRVLAIGLGKKEKFSLDTLRNATGYAIRKCREGGFKKILLPQPFLERFPGGSPRLVEECVYAALLSLYRFIELKTNTADLPADPLWLAICFNDNENSDACQLAARKAEGEAWATCLARNLDNLPGNILYPETLALRTAALASEYHFSCRIMDENALDEAGMGCLLAVGSGSSHPPRLIFMEYSPENAVNEDPLVLVGKGITFDSGGICLKPPANMWQMKCDMSGASAVLATVCALAREKAPIKVAGILACAENMPDGRAFRPGDVLTCANGETVEIINTDAEGRLVLCDALAYAQKVLKPAAIIDIATLTGACAIALGNELAGIFCENEDLRKEIENRGAIGGENYWHMPLWQSYEKQLASEIADIKHTGAREGGAIIAALFLKHFIKPDTAWAHLDIAGVDWNNKATALCPEGATGFGARTLLEVCRAWNAR